MDNISMIQKIRYIFDRKQKVQLLVLGVMIFLGGFLETLGVGAMMPVVMVLIEPDVLMEYIQKYDFLQKICSFSYSGCRTDHDGAIAGADGRLCCEESVYFIFDL